LSKIGFIAVLTLLALTGCSVVRRGAGTNTLAGELTMSSFSPESVRELNITNNNFYIQKAEIEIFNNGEREKLLGSVKYINKEEYLVSVRSRSGIEAARIYVSKDTILINDRINRKLYYGSTGYLERKYGITITFLPMIFGDFRDENKILEGEIKCTEGRAGIEYEAGNNKMYFIIDCKILKIIAINIGNKDNKDGIVLTFKDFIKNNGVKYPERIEVVDNINRTEIKVYIERIEIPFTGTIEFIPGKNYEMVKLQ